MASGGADSARRRTYSLVPLIRLASNGVASANLSTPWLSCPLVRVVVGQNTDQSFLIHYRNLSEPADLHFLMRCIAECYATRRSQGLRSSGRQLSFGLPSSSESLSNLRFRASRGAGTN
jgi:hypothetical protein